MKTRRRVRVAVIDGAECTAEEARWAEEVGAEIAKRDGILVCGGMGAVMEAAARGAQENGGLTVGILPGATASGANPHIEVPIVTGMGDGRNVIVVGSAQAVVAVGGQLGTLSEIAFALKRATPVIGLGTWELDARRLPPGARILHARGPAEAVAMAFKMAKG